ncbi:MAG: hypothetical protein U0165_05260 [Polyangiaceae bacterium]
MHEVAFPKPVFDEAAAADQAAQLTATERRNLRSAYRRVLAALRLVAALD